MGASYEDTPPLLYRFATAAALRAACARRSVPTFSPGRRASLGALPRAQFVGEVSDQLEVRAYRRENDREPRAGLRGKAEGVLVGGTHLATRRPATEQSEGAQLGAPPEPSAADEEDPFRRTGEVLTESSKLRAISMEAPLRD